MTKSELIEELKSLTKIESDHLVKAKSVSYELIESVVPVVVEEMRANAKDSCDVYNWGHVASCCHDVVKDRRMGLVVFGYNDYSLTIDINIENINTSDRKGIISKLRYVLKDKSFCELKIDDDSVKASFIPTPDEFEQIALSLAKIVVSFIDNK